MTHTPTPWEYEHVPESDVFGIWQAHEKDPAYVGRTLSEANAAFIVRAANAHERFCTFINGLTHQNECRKRYKTHDDCNCGIDEIRAIARGEA